MLAADASSRESFESAEATLAVTRAEIASLDAQIVQAEVDVDIAKVNLGYTRIVSPIDGVVVAVITKQGQTVNSMQSAPTIIKVANVATMTIKAQISEADVTASSPACRCTSPFWASRTSAITPRCARWSRRRTRSRRTRRRRH